MTEEKYIKVSDIMEVLESDAFSIHHKLLNLIMKNAQTLDEHKFGVRNCDNCWFDYRRYCPPCMDCDEKFSNWEEKN